MRIGVVGLGTIGIKLIEYLAEKGYNVIAYNWRNIDVKREVFFTNIGKKAKYEKIGLDQLDLAKARVKFTDKLDSLKEADFLIDSSLEDYDEKAKLYAMLVEKHINKVVACTTSSLDLSRLAKCYSPDLFVGMHFFNPPTKMRLVELAFLPENSENTKEIIRTFLQRLDDKMVVELPVMQGYIVNRLLFLFMNSAFQLMEEYELDPLTIDQTMKAGTNMPMGPCELNDYVGTDVTLSILNEFYAVFKNTAFKPSPILQRMVNESRLGRKNKKGFYEY